MESDHSSRPAMISKIARVPDLRCALFLRYGVYGLVGIVACSQSAEPLGSSLRELTIGTDVCGADGNGSGRCWTTFRDAPTALMPALTMQHLAVAGPSCTVTTAGQA